MKYGPEHLRALEARASQALVAHHEAMVAQYDAARLVQHRAAQAKAAQDALAEARQVYPVLADRVLRDARAQRRQQRLDSPWGAMVVVKQQGVAHAGRVTSIGGSGRVQVSVEVLCGSRVEPLGLEEMREQLEVTGGLPGAALGLLRRGRLAYFHCDGCKAKLRAELRPAKPQD